MSGSSDYTRTPNYALYKPNFDADIDAWGTHWNWNADTLDSVIYNLSLGPSNGPFLPLAGGTLTGQLQTPIGNATTPALGIGGPDYGFWRSSTSIQVQTGGTNQTSFNSQGITTEAVQLPFGTPAAPSLSIGGPDGTGLSRSGAAMVFSAQGTASLALFASGGQFYGPLNMLNSKVQTLGDATAAQDALNMRTGDARYLPLTLSGLVNATNDAGAASGGVAVGRVYRNGSQLMVRVT